MHNLNINPKAELQALTFRTKHHPAIIEYTDFLLSGMRAVDIDVPNRYSIFY
jgi:hypothetical protein